MKPRRVLRYLPENYQLAAADERGVLQALLQVMDGMHAPVETVLRGLERYVDPHRAPDPFVLMQASWLGLDRYFLWSGGSSGIGEASFPTGIDRLRLLIAEYPALVRKRGTQEALTRFLEVATGVRGFAIDHGPVGTPFHFQVRVPSGAHSLMAFVEQIVGQERPAHATYEILLANDDSPVALAAVRNSRRHPTKRNDKRRQKE
jgi:phage tail-like protein